jgi:hypothetical protein
MKTTGNMSSESALADCSFRVSSAAMKLTPTKAMPKSPDRRPRRHLCSTKPGIDQHLIDGG